MKWLYRIVAVIAVSSAFALLLSRIPAWQDKAKTDRDKIDFSVFGHQKEATLSDRNVVDALLQIPLHLKIDKVDVSETLLSIDLLLNNPGAERSFVFSDLYELSYFSFRHTANIDQIFVRVMQEVPDREGKLKPYLLVALDARRTDFSGAERGPSKLTSVSMEQYVRSHFRLTETGRWNDLQMN